MVETSIIIRTKNEAKDLGQTLEMIKAQDYQNCEIVVVDSESTDTTLKIAQSYGVRIVKVPAENYRPGKVMNRGATEAKGKYLLYLSAHAIPTTNNWLEKLIRNFDDEQVAAVYGRQIPGEDCDPYQRIFFYGIFDEKRRTQDDSWWFSAVNGAVRKDLWEKLHFDETLSLREDSLWAKQMIRQGYQIIYEPEAVVLHTHRDTYKSVFRKAYKTYCSLGKFDPDFRFSVIKEILDLASALKRIIIMVAKRQAGIIWAWRIVVYWVCRTSGFWLGFRAAQRSRGASS